MSLRGITLAYRTVPGPVDHYFTNVIYTNDAGSESSPVLLVEAGLDQNLLLTEDIILSEINQTQKNKYFMIPLMGDT